MNELLAAIEYSLRECLGRHVKVRINIKSLIFTDSKDDDVRKCELLGKIRKLADAVLRLEEVIGEVEATVKKKEQS